ncbi:MAG: M48 family metalloprotease [Desulfopila sp.]
MYNNLLLFLAAIFLFALDSVPDAPLLPPWCGLAVFLASLGGFHLLARRLYSRPLAMIGSGYFATEKRLSVLALLFYGVGALYLADGKYYLAALPLANRLPALVSVAGLVLFFGYLVIMWRVARPCYQLVFARRYAPLAFIVANIKVNLPIVLPWLVLSLVYDLLSLLPFASVRAMLASQWGDLVFFCVFVAFILVFFPPMVRRLWGCRPLPDGELRGELERFCRQQNFRANLYLWPLFEGKALTAGVMGVLPGLRYILLTPAIISAMDRRELKSVVAHEIGHVKCHHLLLYALLIGGFSLGSSFFAEPLSYFILSRQAVIDLLAGGGISAESAVTFLTGVPLFVLLLLYFRYVFGYFIRNFERQADLHVLRATGDARPLMSAFEKIARLSGNIREQKNWHHFGIGERIDCLYRAQQHPDEIDRHDRKVRYSLIGYGVALLLAVLLAQQVPTEKFVKSYQDRYTVALLMERSSLEPTNPLWQQLIGDAMISRKMEKRARAAYEKALGLDSANPEIMNNLAWLLLTSEDLSIRDPIRGLTLARSAAALHPEGYVLDTLATAYWANDMVAAAQATARQAALVDPARSRMYQQRGLQFGQETYQESVARQRRVPQRQGVD